MCGCAQKGVYVDTSRSVHKCVRAEVEAYASVSIHMCVCVCTDRSVHKCVRAEVEGYMCVCVCTDRRVHKCVCVCIKYRHTACEQLVCWKRLHVCTREKCGCENEVGKCMRT